jgi:trigger factor
VPSSRHVGLEAARQLQQALDQAPGARAGTSAADVTPATRRDADKAIKLAATVTVRVTPSVITEAHVDAALTDVARELSMRQPLGPTQKLAIGDELLVDLVGYLGGEAFTARNDQWLDLRPNPLLPGLFETFIGESAPLQRMVQVHLPPDYPVEDHRDRVAVFAVDLKQARRVVSAGVDEPMLLPLLDRGVKTPRQLRNQVRGDLINAAALQMVEQARRLLLRELYQLCMKDPVPAEAVEEEVTRRWRDFVGEALARQGISVEDQQQSRAAFADENTVAEARRTVWEMRLCDGIASLYRVEANEGEVKAAMRESVGPEIDIEKHAYQQAKLLKEATRALRLRKATDILLKQAKVTFDAPITEQVTIEPLKPAVAASASRPTPIPSRQPPPPPPAKKTSPT